MKIIPKYQAGNIFNNTPRLALNLLKYVPTFWYDDLFKKGDYNPDKYIYSYNTSKLVNPNDLGDPWISNKAGLGSARYVPTRGFNAEQVRALEQEPYYKKFTQDLLANESLRKKFIEDTDKLLPESSLARIEGNKYWNPTTNDVLNRSPRLFNTPEEYLKYARTDQIAGARHNLYLNEGNRYYYIDANNKTHWVSPEDAANYTQELRSSQWNDDKTIFWNDYELTGKRQLPVERGTPVSPVNQTLDLNSKIDPNKIKDPNENKKSGSSILGKLFGGAKGFLNNTKISPFVFAAARAAIDNAYNTKITDQALEHFQVPYQKPLQDYRQVFGDYIAEQQGLQQAARFRSSQPISANGQIQAAYDLEGIAKGNEPISTGNLRSADRFFKTSDAAWEQGYRNLQSRTDTANLNTRLQAETERQKALYKLAQQTQNMQNWDQVGALIQDRALAEHDYNVNRARKFQERMDELGDQLGIDTQLENDLFNKYYAAQYGPNPDYELAEKLRKELINLRKANQLQIYRNMGDRRGVIWSAPWKKLFGEYGINSQYFAKNGGVLRKLQQGGGFPLVQWTPLMGQPYSKYLALLMSGEESSETSSSKSRKSSSSSDDKEESKLLKSIVETLKEDLLPADMSLIADRLNRFFDIQRYAPTDLDEHYLYKGYIDLLTQVNRAKSGKKEKEDAYTRVTQNGGLHEAAIDAQGRVYVGVADTKDIIPVSPTEYLANRDKYQLLTNANLIYLRENDLQFAFNDNLMTNIVSNGVGMDQVGKFVKDFIGKIGTDIDQKDQLVYTFGKTNIAGIDILNNLINKGLTDQETAAIMAKGIDGLWELNSLTETQAKQAKQGLESVLAALPANMRSLLVLRAGSPEAATELVSKMVFTGTSNTTKFSVDDVTALDENGNLKASTKTGKGGTSDSGEALDRTLIDIQSGMGGTPSTFVLQTDQGRFSVDAVDYQPKGAYNAGDLEQVLGDSGLTAIANKSEIYFGDQKVSTEKLSDIAYLGRGFSRVLLPIKNDGSPDLEVTKRFQQACEALKARGYDANKIQNGVDNRLEALKAFAEELNVVGLWDLITDGKPKMSKIGIFLVTEGLGSTKTGLKPSDYVKVKSTTDEDYDLMEKLLSRKGLDGKVEKYELDRPDWGGLWPGDWFGLSDSIYEGTIYIPISNNKLQGATAAGNKVKAGTAKAFEEEFQSFQKLRNYNPGVSTPDNILTQ